MRDVSLMLVMICGVVLAATWVLYPAWLAVRAPGKKPFTTASHHSRWPQVTIVLVVRNAEVALRHALHNLVALAYPADLRRILVVSVDSTDFTEAVARLYAHHGVEVLSIRRPSAGVENHVRRYVDSEIVVRVHPLARLKPGSLASLVSPFADKSVGAAYGREVTGTRESPFRRFEGRLREMETRIFGMVSARNTFYAVRGPLYRAPVPGGLSPDFAELLMAREHGYRAVYVPEATCSLALDQAPRGGYSNLMHAVKRDMTTLLAKRHLLNPRRYGAFAWILLGHKLGRWLSPFALLFGLAGLVMLAPSTPWAFGALIGLLALSLMAGAAWLASSRTGAGRLVSSPFRVLAAMMATAHASLSALLTAPEPLEVSGRPSIGSVRLRF